MEFFYVKSGLGGRTSGGGKTVETGAFGATGLEAGDVYATVLLAYADASPYLVLMPLPAASSASLL